MEEFTPFFDEEDIIVTSYDISMGVRWGVASYRFGTSEDPLYDSVQMLDAAMSRSLPQEGMISNGNRSLRSVHRSYLFTSLAPAR